MSKKLQLKHKHELQALNMKFKSNSERLAKEMKFENIGTIAGLVGLIAAIFWVFDPVGTEKSIGSLGVSLSFIAMLFGGWSYFAPPSQSKTRSENIILNNIQKELQELGYDPYFVDDRAALINSENFLNVWDDDSYEKKLEWVDKAVRSAPNIENEKPPEDLSSKTNDLRQFEIDHKYGLQLSSSEILEDDEFIYYCQTNNSKLVAGWSKVEKKWKVGVEKETLEGLPFSTPRKFEDAVFPKAEKSLSYTRKKFLVEYLSFGLGSGSVKALLMKTSSGDKVELSLDSDLWNGMLIGNQVGVENGLCKYMKKSSEEETYITFGLVCDQWQVKVELVFGDYENFEQHDFSIKEFEGYYL